MRRRQLKALWKRLGQLQNMKLKARELLLKLGEARARYRTAWRLVDIQLPEPTTKGIAAFSFSLNRQKLRQARRREGRYLLRTNLCGREPAELWVVSAFLCVSRFLGLIGCYKMAPRLIHNRPGPGGCENAWDRSVTSQQRTGPEKGDCG